MSRPHRRTSRRAFATVALSCTLAGSVFPALADGDPVQLRPGSHAPAGVLFDHMHKAGEFMVGYRFMYSRQAGDTLHGTNTVSDLAAAGYTMKASSMNMYMSMLDIMYAPTDWLTLMVMPQYVSMDMTMQPLPMLPGMDEHGHGDHGAHMGGPIPTAPTASATPC